MSKSVKLTDFARKAFIAVLAFMAALTVITFTACETTEQEQEQPQTTYYTVSVTATEHGTVTPSVTSAAAGTTVTLTVTPDSGYRLSELKYNDTDVTESKSFTMPESNVTVTAKFEIIPPATYTVNVANVTNGTVTASVTSAAAGTTVTVTATPDDGYRLSELKYNDTDITESKSFTMPEGNVTVTAKFEIIPPATYTVNVANVTNGTVTVSVTSAAAGTTVTVTATPDDGYRLSELKYNDTDITVSKSFTMPEGNVTITATFGKIDYTLTADTAENGTITLSPAATAQIGDTVTVAVTADTGYELTALIYNDGSDHNIEAVSGVYSFTMPAHEVTVSATFGKINYTVTADTTGNGTITLSPATTAQIGDTVTVAVTADTGYELTALVYNDGSDHNIEAVSDVYSFTMPAHEVTVSAMFGKINYTVTADTTGNGTITLSSATAQMGDTVTFSVTPDSNYGMTALRISYPDGDQTVVEYLHETLSFVMPMANVTVLATFKQITHVSTLDQFKAMAEGDLNGYYVLDNDIEFITGQNSPTVGVAPLSAASGVYDERAFTFDKDGTVQEGKAFTGVFDGQGYVLIGMELKSYANMYQNYYRGLFGYIGESGIVRNFTLRDSKVNAAKESAFVAGVNLGLIRNVVIEDNCSIFVTYKGIGAVAAYNGGSIQNVITYVDKGTSNYGDVTFSDGALAYESATGALQSNTYVSPTDDKSSEMGDGWFYHLLVGTAYGNDTYKKFISIETAIYGYEFAVQVYQKVVEETSFYVWSSIGHTGTPFDYVRYDGANYTYYEKLNGSLNYSTVESVEVGIRIGGRYICKAFTLQVKPQGVVVIPDEFSNGTFSGDGMIYSSKSEYALDGNPDTKLWLRNPTAGKYFYVELTKATDISSFRLLTDSNDYFIGTIDYTTDGVNYQKLCEITADNVNADYHYLSDTPVEGVVGLRFNWGDSAKWLQIYEIYINPQVDASAS